VSESTDQLGITTPVAVSGKSKNVPGRFKGLAAFPDGLDGYRAKGYDRHRHDIQKARKGSGEAALGHCASQGHAVGSSTLKPAVLPARNKQ